MELRLTFESFDEFEAYLAREGSNINRFLDKAVLGVEKDGLEEPISGKVFAGSEVRVEHTTPHTSLWAGDYNSRMRAGLIGFQAGIDALPPQARQNPKVVAAEGVTPFSMMLRTKYKNFLPTEFLPTKEEQDKFYPIKHLDLTNMDLPDESFDIFFSAHVLEHVPDLDKSLEEMYRILRPGGVAVNTYPFKSKQAETDVKALLKEDGTIDFLSEPVYHRNPVDHEGGSLVFQLPGWDILDKCRAIGFDEAVIMLISSSKHGVFGTREIGSYALITRKTREGDEPGLKRIRQMRSLQDMAAIH